MLEETPKRYLVVLPFTGLNSKKHKKLKLDVKHNWTRNNNESLSRIRGRLIETLGGYKGRRVQRRCNPNSQGVTPVHTNVQGHGQEGHGDFSGRQPGG